jgi:hypothetical protein
MKIRLTLATAKKPMSTSELLHSTGMARNTLMTALDADESIRKIEGFPTRWELMVEPDVAKGKLVVPYVEPLNGWPAWVEDAREKLPRLLKLDPRMPREKREESAYLLRGMAQYLVSLSRDLEETKDFPDWYQQLGGSPDK